jgi:hypothetical protein
MSGILNKFRVEHGIYGARVMLRSDPLTPKCSSDDEIDTNIQMLKDDLDACAREMKRLLEVNRRGSLFEGWPSAKDGMLDA